MLLDLVDLGILRHTFKKCVGGNKRSKTVAKLTYPALILFMYIALDFIYFIRLNLLPNYLQFRLKYPTLGDNYIFFDLLQLKQY